MTTAVDPMTLARDERADLAELLAGLSPEQWEAPTLCTRWRVRDVVAHMFSYDDLGKAGVVGRFLHGGLNPDKVNQVGVDAYADRTPADLLALVRSHQQPRGLTAGFGGRIALTDGVIHHQDIRRSLGLPREIPDDRLRCALDFGRTARPIGAKKRVQGLTLTATDLDWSAGDGPVVEGPAESLLMAMGGRRGIVDELSGPGLPTLAERIGG
jgi:uncharacterized protein (TIGR03083 family)